MADAAVPPARRTQSGHHPAVLFEPEDHTPQLLGLRDPPVGVDAAWRFEQRTLPIAPHSRMYLFSDGAFEVECPGGALMGQDELRRILSQVVARPSERLGDGVCAISSPRPGHPCALP